MNRGLNDKMQIDEYLARIYVTLSEEIRNKLENLNISEKKKKSIIRELAFLSKKKQFKYMAELYRIYQRILD